MATFKFPCHLISPFHSAAERYSNVHTCAPYILGSTLRGAVLSQVIKHYCTEEHFEHLKKEGNNPSYHTKSCPAPCGLRDLFDPNKTWFSFGEFSLTQLYRRNDGKEPDKRVYFRTRIAIDRETWSVAKRALLQFEIRPANRNELNNGSRFSFTIDLPEELTSGEPWTKICEAIKWAGFFGIGAFRNQGFGRFDVGKPEPITPEPVKELPPDEYIFVAVTPYTLADPFKATRPHPDCASPLQENIEKAMQLPFGKERFLIDADQALGPGWSNEHIEDVQILEASLGYVGRFCLEDDTRHTRAVAREGSALLVKVKQAIPSDQVARLLGGIGEWNHFGFGRWRIVNPKNEKSKFRRHFHWG